MCSRWGSDLGRTDQQLVYNLQDLIGHDLSWWCKYIGTLARVIATIHPAFGVGAVQGKLSTISEKLSLRSEVSHGLGKKGHKVGIRLAIYLDNSESIGMPIGDLESLFSKVGKGLNTDWKVEAEVLNTPQEMRQ